MTGLLVEMQWQSVFSLDKEGWDYCLPWNTLHLVLGLPEETVGCFQVGETSIPYQQDLAVSRCMKDSQDSKM